MRIVWLFFLMLLSGCAGEVSQSVVYGKSGKAFTAPDDASAWQNCLAHDAPCRE
jgi:hypothetical protein